MTTRYPTVPELSHTAKTYNEHEKDANAKLDEIHLLLASHARADYPEKINYGHIGDLCHVEELLDEVISFLNGNGGE